MNLLPTTEIDKLYQAESEQFLQRIPRSLALHKRAKDVMPNGVPMTWMVGLYDHPTLFMERGDGAWMEDVDGNRYLDMNNADMSMTCGYAPESIVKAVSAQVARGSQFLLPTELAIEVSELLASRFGLPKWQYTLSASLANKECIKVARAHTGRQHVLVFDGSYHGHLPETLDAEPASADQASLPESVTIPYNDLAVLEQMLSRRVFALVLIEAAMTNISLVKPDEGYLEGVRQLCKQYGTLLLVDETHTHVCAYGGLSREWKINPDFLVAGKAIAGGIPMGIYGMREEIAATLELNTERDKWPEDYTEGLPLGGTLFGYPLALAAAKAALTEILTPEAHQRTAALGTYLADGLAEIAARRNLPWSAFRLFCRTGICFAETAPRNAEEARAQANFTLNRYQRLFLANRGVWEAVLTAGPVVSFAMTRSDVDLYLDVFEQMALSVTEN